MKVMARNLLKKNGFLFKQLVDESYKRSRKQAVLIQSSKSEEN